MNSIKCILFGLLLSARLLSLGQSKQVEQRTFEYGKINLQEFDVKPTGIDSSASAIVLFDVGRAKFELSGSHGGFEFILERHIRYKIVKKAGYDFANLEIRLFRVNNAKTILDDLDGATYNLENGKIITSKITKSSKFTEKQDKNFTIKKFALPDIKEGSIIEFKYKLSSDFLFTLLPWYFQRDIPVLYSEYDIRIPHFYKYKITPNGPLTPEPKRQILVQNFSAYYAMGKASVVRQLYCAENIPSLKPEGFITTMDDYVSKVEFELNSVATPGTSFLDYTKSWPKIVTQLIGETRFGGYLEKKAHTKAILANIIKADTKTDTIPYLIFNYVKNNIKWNKQTSFYTSENDPKKVLEKKSGNSADINLMLLTLLKEAKVEAAPILLSTRENGKHPKWPLLSKFNNVIIDVKIGERHVFLDATNKNHTPDIVAFENLNHEGLRIDLNKVAANWVNTEEFKMSKKSANYFLTLNTDNKLTGKLVLSSTNYEALDRRNQYLSSASEADFLNLYRNTKPGLAIKNYKAENLDNPDESLIETMDIRIEDNVDTAGNLIYFAPLLFEKTKENPFKLDQRKYPVDFGKPREEVCMVSIELPKNYQLDKLPKNEKISLPDEGGTFSFVFAKEENKISVISKISIKKSIYSPAEYYDLKELFKNIVRKQAEQIVLKKI